MFINVQDYSPAGDGVTDDTLVVQKAIDICSNSGGGTVFFPENTQYIISGIFLKSNVELSISKGTTLIGSGIKNKYIKREGPFERLNSNGSLYGLIYSKNTENIKITGLGSIDGNYNSFSSLDKDNPEHRQVEEYPRPTTIYFEGCKNIEISGISIVNVPFWTIHLVGCYNSLFFRLSIINDLAMPNTDGIDIDRCKNTLIEECKIFTADDAICPKCTEETQQYGDMENLVVRNCSLISTSSAIKFGSSSFGNFKNCTFEDINITESNRGLAFQIRDTHSVENIIFRRITIQTKRYNDAWWGRGEPIYVTICPREENQKIGKISNVSFEDIDCIAENGIFIYSTDKDQIKDIKFKNIKIKLKKSSASNLSEFDLRPTCKKETSNQKLKPFVIVNSKKGVSKENISILYN